MKEHIAYINQFCRLCKSSVSRTYNIKNYVSEINFMYRSERIDINSDDHNCQSGMLCTSCYRVILKCQEEIKFKKKNPSSAKIFAYKRPPYAENIMVHKVAGCECGLGGPSGEPEQGPGPSGEQHQQEQEQLTAGTPSKVRRLEEDAAESPSDKLTARELKRKEPSRPSIKFRLDKVEEDFETGEIFVEGTSVKKIYTSQESFSRSRISNMDVAKFFVCRVCGKYPKQAKVSVNCRHIYCKICIDNYKAGVNTTKCPPASLHHTIAKLFQEKYLEIEEEMKKSPDYYDIINDPDKKIKVHAKVCFDDSFEIFQRGKQTSCK